VGEGLGVQSELSLISEASRSCEDHSIKPLAPFIDESQGHGGSLSGGCRDHIEGNEAVAPVSGL
jgi:hypothetical protein